MARTGIAKGASSFLISAILVLFVNIWNSPMYCTGHIFIQGLARVCDSNNPNIVVDQSVSILDMPTPVTTPCTFTLKKSSSNICQVKLDFEAFNSAGANMEGDCDVDQLRITNSITVNRNFTTCGNLAGQHMYLAFGNEETIEVSPVITRTTSQYIIKATMIPCTSADRAPDYCLQYFTTPTGTVKSFDFGGQQQNNQKYTVCVKPLEINFYTGYYSTSVRWTPCYTGGAGSAFNIVTEFMVQPHTCDTDWIQVKGGPRVCESFDEISSQWKPYELLVNFNEYEYPPQPPVWNEPMDPLNCPATCGGLDPINCQCIPWGAPAGTEQTCQCALQDPSGPTPDFDNVGFCLDYKQL